MKNALDAIEQEVRAMQRVERATGDNPGADRAYDAVLMLVAEQRVRDPTAPAVTVPLHTGPACHGCSLPTVRPNGTCSVCGAFAGPLLKT